MKSNKGFSRFEIIVVLLVVIIVIVLSYSWLLKPSNKQQIETMKRDALVFSNTVSANISTFRSTDVVYLDEVISEQLLKEIKNPFGKGGCDITESKVVFFNGIAYPTLKCGDYLIENGDLNNLDNSVLFKVGNWSSDIINDNSESKVLYNCIKNDKEVFDNYYEEEYFIYKYNLKYKRDINSIMDVNKKDCKIISNSFYRVKNYVN